MVDRTHTRILLANNRSGSVDMCEACEVVEINLGATSLRFAEQDLPAVAALLMEADRKLKLYQHAKSALTPWKPMNQRELN